MSPHYQDQTAEIEALRDRIQKLLSNIERLIDGKEAAAAEERAKIVVWLKDIDPYALACGVRHACANAIEAKEHLK
jgi:hypothetical protein